MNLKEVNKQLRSYSLQIIREAYNPYATRVNRFSLWDLTVGKLDGNFADLDSAYKLAVEYLTENKGTTGFSPLIDTDKITVRRAKQG